MAETKQLPRVKVPGQLRDKAPKVKNLTPQRVTGQPEVDWSNPDVTIPVGDSTKQNITAAMQAMIQHKQMAETEFKNYSGLMSAVVEGELKEKAAMSMFRFNAEKGVIEVKFQAVDVN